MGLQAEYVEGKISEANAILHPEAYGSDLSVLIDKIVAWIKSLDLGGIPTETLHTLYHYATEELIPQVLDMSATKLDNVLYQTVILPLLQKIHDAYFPHQ